MSLGALLPAATRAADLPPTTQLVDYEVVDQDVGGVIAGIAAELGLRSDVSGHVHGRVHGRMPPAPPRVALDRLGALYGFDWFTDGRTVFASGYDEAVRHVLTLGAVGGAAFLRNVQSLGIEDQRWPIRLAETGDVAVVSGPPRYVSAIEDTLAALQRHQQTGTEEVHVFRGVASGS